MRHAVLQGKNLSPLVEAIRKKATLFAPIMDAAGGLVFGEPASAADIAFGPSNTRLSVKGVFFPQREVLLSFKAGELGEVPALDVNLLVFGARPCDLRSMTWMDEVFGGGGREDPYFVRRRRGAVVIGLACDEPCATCFCTSVGGSPYGSDGADVLASVAAVPRPGAGADAAAPDLLLEAATDKGAAFLQEHDALMRPAHPEELDARQTRARAAAARMPVLDFSGVKEKMDAGFDSPAWDTITRSCLGCGACTYVCPTCHCFDITDESHGDRGVRIRTWDGCQYASFTLHASGHNPRSHKRARMRQRLMHKYAYAPETSGAVFCSGCGRCVRSCPVNLDIRQMLAALKDQP